MIRFARLKIRVRVLEKPMKLSKALQLLILLVDLNASRTVSSRYSFYLRGHQDGSGQDSHHGRSERFWMRGENLFNYEEAGYWGYGRESKWVRPS